MTTFSVVTGADGAGDGADAGTGAGLAAARDQRQRLYRFLALTGMIGAVLGLLAATVALVMGPNGYAPGFVPVAIAVQLGATGWVVADLWRGRPNTAGLRVYVVTAVALEVAHIWLWRMPPSAVMPPLFTALVVGMCMAPLAFRRPVAIALQITHAVAFGIVRAPQVGFPVVILDALVTLGAGLICTFALQPLDTVMSNLEAAFRTESAAAEDRAARQARTLARAEWRDVLHGKVIAALLAAAAGASDAPRFARQALAALTPVTTEPEQFSAAVEALASEQGLDLTLTVDGRPANPRIERGLIGCVAELLANVARHSGQRSARVLATFTPSRWVVEVSDPGVGFDPAAIRAHHGLSVSVRQPWAALGGEVGFGPRARPGTLVRLTWTAERAAKAIPTWQAGQFGPMLVVLALNLACHGVLGWMLGGPVRSTLVLGLGIVAIWVLTLVPLWSHPTRVAVALTVTAVAWAGLMADNLASPFGGDWQFWFGGALAALCGLLSFHGRPWFALLVVVFSYAITALILLRQGLPPSAVGIAVGAFVAPLTVIIPAQAGPLVNRMRDSVWRELERARWEMADSVGFGAKEEEWRRQDALLRAHVMPMLERIAAGRAVSGEDAVRCAALEQSCRDLLRSPTLSTGPLATAAIEARVRGADVRLDLPPEATPRALASANAAALAVLPALGGGDGLAISASEPGWALFLRRPSGALDGLAAATVASLRAAGEEPVVDVRDTWALIEVP